MSIPMAQTMMPSMPIYPSNSYQPNAASVPTLTNKQEVIRVDGIEGAYKCDLPVNTGSIIVVDMYKPLAYLISTNGINRTVQAFDIQPHQEPITNPVSASQPETDIVAELRKLGERLGAMEVTIDELKSNSGGFKQHGGKRNNSNGKSDGPSESVPAGNQ